jgi:hypothetical protein
MTIETIDKIVRWAMIAAGLLYILACMAALTSCTPMPTAQPVTVTASQAPTIAATVTQWVTPTLTPTPTYQPNKCRLHKGGNRIADCFRIKGVKP